MVDLGNESLAIRDLTRELLELGWREVPSASPRDWRADLIVADARSNLLCIELKLGSGPLHSRIASVLQNARDELAETWKGRVFVVLISSNQISERVQAVLASSGVILYTIRQGANWQSVAEDLTARIGKPLASRRLQEVGTTTGLMNQASAAVDEGRWADAITQYEEILGLQRRIFGRRHPVVADTIRRLALIRSHTGDFETGIHEIEQYLSDQEGTSNSDSQELFDLRESVANLHLERARWNGDRADLDRANHLFSELLVDQARVLGPDHPDTIATRQEVAEMRLRRFELTQDGAELDMALADLTKLIEDGSRIFGPEHPSVIKAAYMIAGIFALKFELFGELSYLDEALRRYRNVLVSESRVLGPDNPDTLTTREMTVEVLARRFAATLNEAELSHLLGEYRELALDRVRVLGPDHSSTIRTRYRFALALREQYNRGGRLDDLDESITNLRAVLESEQRALGPDSSESLITAESLGQTLALRFQATSAASDIEDAIEVLRRSLFSLDTASNSTQIEYELRVRRLLAEVLLLRFQSQRSVLDLQDAQEIYQGLLSWCERNLAAGSAFTEEARLGLARVEMIIADEI